MKSTGQIAHRRLFIPFLALLGLVGWGGYWKGGKDASYQGGDATGTVARLPYPNQQDGGGIATPQGSSPADLDRLRGEFSEILNRSPHSTWDPECRAETLRLLKKLGPGAVDLFLAGCLEDPRFGPRTNWSVVYLWWAGADGQAALESMLRRRGNPRVGSSSMFNILAQEWAKTDTDAAMAWMRREEKDPALRRIMDNMLEHVLSSSVPDQPGQAATWLASFPPAEKGDRLAAMGSRYGSDPEMRGKILEMAASTGRPEDLAAARFTVVRAWAMEDPSAAREYLGSLSLGSNESTALEIAVTVGESIKNPTDALGGWLGKNENATSVPEEIVNAIGRWASDDPETMMSWLESVPDGEQRDLLHASSIGVIAGYENFDEAVTLVSGIQSPELRAHAIRELASIWRVFEPEDAEKWKNTLPEIDRAALSE